MIVCKIDDYHEVNLSAMKFFLNDKKMKGIYVSFNHGQEKLWRQFESDSIDVSKLYIEGAISNVPKYVRNTENFTYIGNPKMLTKLSIVISDKLNTGKYDFLYFDSISTMLIYNDIDMVGRFSHFVFNKLSSMGIKVVIISLDDEKSKKISPMISHFCDKCIRL